MGKEKILNSKQRLALRKGLGNLVRERRKLIGLSQEDLGFECGLHRTYIGAIERGETNLTLEGMAILATSLGCQIVDLIPHIDI